MNRTSHRSLLRFAAILGLPVALAGGQEPAAPATSTPLSVENAVDVVTRWTPDQHLYVKGDVGLPAWKLADLEAWLDAQAPNWTVVLTENARGESFRDADGRTYNGMDAVDHALGKSLANTTAFGDLVDSRTGEANGAFFILYLQERKFTYYGSEAFDRRNLGEARWIGKLDQPAIRAMRGGGRILDAAKDTITSIEEQLTRKIEAEKAATRRAEIRKQEVLAENRESIRVLESDIAAVENSVAAYRDQHPAATGDLVRPDLAEWRAELETARSLTDSGEFEEPVSLLRRVEEALAGFRERFASLVEGPDEISDLEKRLASHPPVPEVPAAEGLRLRAREALESARENLAGADGLFLTQLAAGHAALDESERTIDAWKRAVEAERKRREQHRQLLLVGLGLAIALLIAALVIANRLRRPARDAAEKALADWQAALTGRFDILFELMDRAALVTGTSSGLKERGYAGTTLDLSRQVIRLVDELFLMSSGADTVMNLASAAIEPKGPLGKLINAFSSRRYRKGCRILESDAIGFDREAGLESILRPERGGKEALLGEESDYEPFRMTFTDLVAAYDEKQAEASEKLDRLAKGIDGLPVSLEAARESLLRLRERSSKLLREGKIDGHFPLESLEIRLATEAERTLDETAELGRTDLVSAHEGPAARTLEMLAAGNHLAGRIERWRADEKPYIEKALGDLRGRERRTAWIADAYAASADSAERAIEAIVAGSAAEAMESFESELASTGLRVEQAVALAARAAEESAPAIDRVESSVDSERRSLAEFLACAPARLFEEEERRPADFLEEAKRDLANAFTALDRGEIEFARNSLDEVDVGLKTVEAILARSRALFETFDDRDAQLTRLSEAATASVEKAREQVETIRNGYDSAVLRFASRYPFPGDVEGLVTLSDRSVDEALEAARQSRAEGRQAHVEAGQARAALHPIGAGEAIERATTLFEEATDEARAIEEHFADLVGAESENPESRRRAGDRHGDLADDIADARTRRQTVDEWNRLGAELEGIAAAMSSEHPNPFATRADLVELDHQLDALGDRIVSDWDFHARAVATLSATRESLRKLESRVDRSQNDRIPDSPETTRAVVAFERHGEQLAELESRLSGSHGDWEKLEREGTERASAILLTLAVLERELEQGEACATALAEAASQIRKVTDWRSRYRISLDRQAGSASYWNGYDAFSRGDYDSASRLARQAREEAHRVVEQAAYEENRARDRERQAARAALLASQSTRSRSSSFGGSRSSSSSRSRTSRSSFSSRSGTSRSGW